MDEVTYQFYVGRYQRIYTVSEPDKDSLKMGVCAIAEVLTEHAKADNIQDEGAVSSASIGSVSVSYTTPSSAERTESRKSLQRDCLDAFMLYCDVYRG